MLRQDAVTGMRVCGRQSVRDALDPGGCPEFLMFARNQRTSEGSKDLEVTVGHIRLKAVLYKDIKYGLEEFFIYSLIS